MIVIKDMKEIPSCCYECPYFDDYCALTGKWERDTEQVRDKDCPLVEVVTCKECKYWHDDGIMTTCDKNIGNGFPKDYYCADGERRE